MLLFLAAGVALTHSGTFKFPPQSEHQIKLTIFTFAALECTQCTSTVDWDDCFNHSTKVTCTKYCFLLEELDPPSNEMHFKQGCTDNVNYCAEKHRPDPDSFCSLCSDDDSFCTSVSHRDHINHTTPIPSLNNGTTDDKPNLVSSITSSIRKQLTEAKEKSQHWLHGLVDQVLGDKHSQKDLSNSDENSTATTGTEETSTSPSVDKKTTDNSTGTTVVPCSSEHDAVSGSKNGLTNAWISVGLVTVLNIVIRRI